MGVCSANKSISIPKQYDISRKKCRELWSQLSNQGKIEIIQEIIKLHSLSKKQFDILLYFYVETITQQSTKLGMLGQQLLDKKMREKLVLEFLYKKQSQKITRYLKFLVNSQIQTLQENSSSKKQEKEKCNSCNFDFSTKVESYSNNHNTNTNSNSFSNSNAGQLPTIADLFLQLPQSSSSQNTCKEVNESSQKSEKHQNLQIESLLDLSPQSKHLNYTSKEMEEIYEIEKQVQYMSYNFKQFQTTAN